MASTITPITVDIPPEGFDELEQLAKHANRLDEIIRLSATFRLDADLAKVSKAVAEQSKIDAAEASLVLSGLTNLAGMASKYFSEPGELLKFITESLQTEAPDEWLAKNFDGWCAANKTVIAALERFTPDHPLRMRQKARELTYAHQNIFRNSRIITDLRPVFTADGTRIVAMVLTHVLGIEYFDGVRMQRIEFALDATDVADLKDAAERAQTKTDTTRSTMSGGPVPLIIAGEPPTSYR